MGTWNIAVTIWVLRSRRNNHKPGNPHPPPCEEHGNKLTRIETAIETARTEASNSHRDLRRDLVGTQKTVAVLWNETHPGQPEPNKR
jgi:hypothetical protein